MYPCKYRAPSSSSLDSCQKEKLRCAKEKGKPCCCRCPRRLDPYETVKDNMRDVTESIAKILEIIGIDPEIVGPSRQLIFALFHHYDCARWSFDPKEPEKICKEHIMHILMKVFDMQRVEAEMTYYVTKRAFKAYFSNKCKGLLNAALDTEVTAQDTGAWRHAARTTARIIEEHEPLLPRLQPHYEQKIRKVYFEMCQKIQKRVDPLMVPYCRCKGCAAVKVPVSTDFTKDEVVSDEYLNKKECKCSMCAPYKGGKLHKPGQKAQRPNKWEIFGIDNRNCEGRVQPSFRNCVDKNNRNSVLDDEDNICLYRRDPPKEVPGVPWCYKCKIYKMICDCQDNGNRESQGPFETFWVRVYDDDDEMVPGDIKNDPENHHCPIDCADLSLMSDSTEEGEEEEDDVCHCCDEGEEEDESTDDEERNANFVQPYCYCQQQDDIGI